MTFTQEQFEALQKRAVRAEKALALNAAERGLFLTLNADQQDEFLTLSPSGRSSELTKAESANPVVYTDGKGRTFRKSDDQRLVEMAKDADEANRERVESAKLAKADRIAKAVNEYQHLPGDLAQRSMLIEAIEAMPEANRAPLHALLKSFNGEMSKAFAKAGTRAGVDNASDSPEVKLQAMAKSLRDKNPALTEAQAMVQVMQTDEGKELYSEHRTGKR